MSGELRAGIHRRPKPQRLISGSRVVNDPAGAAPAPAGMGRCPFDLEGEVVGTVHGRSRAANPDSEAAECAPAFYRWATGSPNRYELRGRVEPASADLQPFGLAGLVVEIDLVDFASNISFARLLR